MIYVSGSRRGKRLSCYLESRIICSKLKAIGIPKNEKHDWVKFSLFLARYNEFVIFWPVKTWKSVLSIFQAAAVI